MKKFFSKKRNIVIAVIVVIALAAAGVGGYYYFFVGTSSEDIAYVSSVATITGQTANGLNNRYAGVVEAEETWSVALDSSLTVSETYVEVGQEVEADTPLFSYDMTETEASLRSAQLELERLNNELTAMQTDLNELVAARDATGDESAKAEYTVEIQQSQLDITSKQYDITSKKEEITKLQETLNKGTVNSKIAGVVKSIASSDSSEMSDSNAFITIVNMNKFQIKGSVNEQNLASLSADLPVIVYSRSDSEAYWKGTITKVDSNNATSNGSDETDSDEMTSSSNYPFYVSVEDTTGLNMGQHVYIELDQGQLEEDTSAISLEEYYIDMTDEQNPFVWVDEDGKLAKRSVTLGEYNEDTMTYVITDGLDLTDLIAVPYEGLKEGMETSNMDEVDTEDVSEEGDYEESEESEGDVEELTDDSEMEDEGEIEE
ncbi:MAG: efflux RND transporter periplasmic adaptor subunit [Lachnospiraceae bacterium]|nr:efflux RND transporter periplasmic adaptor subunit [Lachnospiraceae bacterium]